MKIRKSGKYISESMYVNKYEIIKICWTKHVFLTSEYLLYEFPRGNQVDGLPRVSHDLRAELIDGVWKTKVPDLAQVELAHTQSLPS